MSSLGSIEDVFNQHVFHVLIICDRYIKHIILLLHYIVTSSYKPLALEVRTMEGKQIQNN